MKRIFIFLLLSFFTLSFLCSCEQKTVQISSVKLPKGVERVKYIVVPENSEKKTIFGIDFSEPSEWSLKRKDLVHYKKVFGPVKNEQAAVDIATIVFSEVYKNCPKDEAPFEVMFNKRAGAWIVQGTLPPDVLGGVASIGIKKDTGKIIFVRHSK